MRLLLANEILRGSCPIVSYRVDGRSTLCCSVVECCEMLEHAGIFPQFEKKIWRRWPGRRKEEVTRVSPDFYVMRLYSECIGLLYTVGNIFANRLVILCWMGIESYINMPLISWLRASEYYFYEEMIRCMKGRYWRPTSRWYAREIIWNTYFETSYWWQNYWDQHLYDFSSLLVRCNHNTTLYGKLSVKLWRLST